MYHNLAVSHCYFLGKICCKITSTHLSKPPKMATVIMTCYVHHKYTPGGVYIFSLIFFTFTDKYGRQFWHPIPIINK